MNKTSDFFAIIAALIVALCVSNAQAVTPRAQAAKGQRPATSVAGPQTRNARMAQLHSQARGLARQHALNKSRETRLGNRLERARILENGARRSYETLVKTRGERSPEARSARRTLDASRASRANIESSLDTARSQTQTSRRRNNEARLALTRARRGDWAGSNRADARANRAPLPRARRIRFAPTVQIRTVSMAPEVVEARKGQLKPKRR